MGRAFIKAELDEIADLVQEWAESNNLSIATDALTTRDKEHDHSVRHIQFNAEGTFYVATWRCQSDSGGFAINMILKPALYVNAILHAVLFLGLWYTIATMRDVTSEYTASNLLKFISCATCVMLTFWWKDRKLASRLAILENSFWDMVRRAHDIRQITRTEGNLYTMASRVSTELLLLGAAVYIGIILFGTWGAVISLLLCAPILSMNIANLLQNANPHWHWRLWIIDNMGNWTLLMLRMLAIVPVLLSVEIFLNLELYHSDSSPSIVVTVHSFFEKNHEKT